MTKMIATYADCDCTDDPGMAAADLDRWRAGIGGVRWAGAFPLAKGGGSVLVAVGALEAAGWNASESGMASFSPGAGPTLAGMADPLGDQIASPLPAATLPGFRPQLNT
jgi:hypothetical protein